MRDNILNKGYFDEYILKKDRFINSFKSMLKNNEVDSERINNVIEEVFRQNLYKLIAKYSAGYPIKELYCDYYEAVEYMHQSWMVLDNRAFLNDKKFGHYFGSDYNVMLWMLSIGYLLNVEENAFLKLMEIIDKDGVKDLIYETIIKAKIPSRESLVAETYQMIFDIPYVYEKLRQAIHEGIDGIWDKDRQRDLVEVFIKKDWYPRHKDFSFYDNHKSKANVYYGYWSFETAAICKILEVDISKIIDFKYFPKDLFLYNR